MKTSKTTFRFLASTASATPQGDKPPIPVDVSDKELESEEEASVQGENVTALVPFSPPPLLTRCFTNHLTNGTTWFADCKYCRVEKRKKGVTGNQSNFRKHLRNSHPVEFKKFEESERTTSKTKIITNSLHDSYGFSCGQQPPPTRKSDAWTKYYDQLLIKHLTT